MITARIVHQQIFQLKWHFLACVALIMVLPLEGAFVNLHAGDGFYSSGWTGLTLLLAPLLAGLIACANVQADLDEKRYLFWRSKPAGVWGLVSLKYITGLIMALVIMACPMLFTVITTAVCTGERPEWSFLVEMSIIFILLSLLVYSTCFLTNVLVRKTAQAWLIGMAWSCFVLLLPFLLPLGFKDIVSDMDFWAWAVYLSLTLGTTILAFVLAILAVKHDWHLHTKLRGLLWAGAGLIFGLMLLFSQQIANIRILDEMPIKEPTQDFRLVKQAGRTVLPLAQGLSTRTAIENGKMNIDDIATLKRMYGLPDRYELGSANNKLELNHIQATASEATLSELKAMARRFAVEKDLLSQPYPQRGIYHKIGPELYSLAMHPYHMEEQYTDEYGDVKFRYYWKKAYLRCFRVVEGVRIPHSSLDLSACIIKDGYPSTAMHMAKDNMLALVIGNQCMTIQVSESGDLQQLERKKLKAHSVFHSGGRRPIEIPLIPLDSLDTTTRIRLSIDGYYLGRHFYYDRMKASLVHEERGQISFVQISGRRISRYDVSGWDQENIHCRFRDSRALSLFERPSFRYDRYFVQYGKLYAYDDHTLIVFDVGSDRGIRKLGHYERISSRFGIRDIAVESDGSILMLAETNRRHYGKYESKPRLFLLKNPK